MASNYDHLLLHSPRLPISPRSPSPIPKSHRSAVLTVALSATLLAFLLATVAKQLFFTTPGGGMIANPDTTQLLIENHLGAVATENAICSNIGIDVLQQGGNAADSLIASLLCVGVIGMYHSGIGGGGFMLVRSPNGDYESIDFRESAPAAAFQDMYQNNSQASVFGGLSVAVPGEIRGLQYLHEKYGSLPWQTLVEPAVKVARYGFPVTKDMARYLGLDKGSPPERHDFLIRDPTWALDFAPNGTLIGLGDTLYRKRYADTLETIGRDGPDAFYTGAIAETMVRAVQAANGTMTMDDLTNYKIEIRPTAEIDYRGYKVFSTSAPSSGGVVLSVLKLVEGYEDFFMPDQVNISTHRLDEAIRFGYGQRASLGDPGFLEGMAAYEEEMMDATTAARNRARISDSHTLNVSAYDPDGLESLETHGTSHVVTADHTGLAITLTSTINLYFGSQLMVPETGIIMNDEMDDFSIPGQKNAFGYAPSPSNYVRPHKRPLSSITPVIVEFSNRTLYYVLGAAGGSRIITATIQNLIHVLDRNMTASQALAQPRLHDQLIPNRVEFEYAYDNTTVEFMKGRGHEVLWVPPRLTAAQGLRRLPNGTFEAAGEPRQLDSGGFAI